MLFSHTLWSPAADQPLLHLRMFASGRNFRPPTSYLRPPEPASPLECTLTKNAPASPLESTLAKLLDLKSPGMNTYKKSGWGPPSLTLNDEVHHARKTPAR